MKKKYLLNNISCNNMKIYTISKKNKKIKKIDLKPSNVF
jgi:hypothetical protein